jgi:hypothetical protein
VVVRIPLGDGWRREGREPPDHHRSRWYARDFTGYAGTLRQYDFHGNPYGLALLEAGSPAGVPRLADVSLLADVSHRLALIERRLERLVPP